MTIEQKVVYLDGTEKVVYVDDLLDPNKNGSRDFFRAKGRSTRQALAMVHQALARPNHYVPIIDHYQTSSANRMLAEKVSKIIGSLGIHGLCITRASRMTGKDLYKAKLQEIPGHPSTFEDIMFVIFDEEEDERKHQRNIQNEYLLKF